MKYVKENIWGILGVMISILGIYITIYPDKFKDMNNNEIMFIGKIFELGGIILFVVTYTNNILTNRTNKLVKYIKSLNKQQETVIGLIDEKLFDNGILDHKLMDDRYYKMASKYAEIIDKTVQDSEKEILNK